MDIISSNNKDFSIENLISHSLLNHLYEGIYFVDKHRRIRFWSKGAERISGYTKEDVSGHFCFEGILKHEDDFGNIICNGKCPLVRSIEMDQHIDERIYLRHKQGHLIPVWTHVSPIKNQNGEIIGAIEVFNDDSDYEKLKQANIELEKLNQLKNQFLGMAAHDLRTPLGTALNFSSFLLDAHNENLTERQVALIARIKNACDSMLLLINDLLSITAIESGKINLAKRFINIEELIYLDHYSAKLLADHKKIFISLDIQPKLPQMYVDTNRINQVMENLLSNAVKFSYPETTINIKVYRRDNNIVIAVIDEGQGIPKKDLPNLFKPFEKKSVQPTAKESSTGLGLPIVKKIVEMHGGKLEVESQINKGTEFRVVLPFRS